MATPPKTAKNPVKKTAAKPPAAGPKAAKPEVMVEAKAATGLRLKDLVDRVAESSGVKKQDAKKVVEATLIQMGQALKNGDGLNLVGLGRIRVAKAAAEEGGAMTLKLRMATPGQKAKKPSAEPIADAEDQD